METEAANRRPRKRVSPARKFTAVLAATSALAGAGVAAGLVMDRVSPAAVTTMASASDSTASPPTTTNTTAKSTTSTSTVPSSTRTSGSTAKASTTSRAS